MTNAKTKLTPNGNDYETVLAKMFVVWSGASDHALEGLGENDKLLGEIAELAECSIDGYKTKDSDKVKIGEAVIKEVAKYLESQADAFENTYSHLFIDSEAA